MDESQSQKGRKGRAIDSFFIFRHSFLYAIVLFILPSLYHGIPLCVVGREKEDGIHVLEGKKGKRSLDFRLYI